MNISAHLFDQAFEILQEFGPKRKIPVEQRWRKQLPEIPEAEYAELKARCEEIENFAVGLAFDELDSKITDGFQVFKRKYPDLTKARMDRVWSQAMYCAHK